MLVDTHCHLNLMVKEQFDVPINNEECQKAQKIIDDARAHQVDIIICVGTSLVESENCVRLAHAYSSVYASVGIHPNDVTSTWKNDLQAIKKMIDADLVEKKIVAIGECGIDRHYEKFDLQLQKDAFKAQIELALECDRALIIHSRDAREETLRCLDEFKHPSLRGVMHCFSEDLEIARESIEKGFVLGVGGTVTYPKNDILRTVVQTVGSEHIILETDAPYLPPQQIRGQKNHPQEIKTIASYIGNLLGHSLEEIAVTTTGNARRIFNLP